MVKHTQTICEVGTSNIKKFLLKRFNAIQDRGVKRPPNQFFPCNFYKRMRTSLIEMLVTEPWSHDHIYNVI